MKTGEPLTGGAGAIGTAITDVLTELTKAFGGSYRLSMILRCVDDDEMSFIVTTDEAEPMLDLMRSLSAEGTRYPIGEPEVLH